MERIRRNPIFLTIAIVLKIIVIVTFLVGSLPSLWFLLLLNPLTAIFLSYHLTRNEDQKVGPLSILVLDILIPVFAIVAIGTFFLLSPVYKMLYKDHKIDVYDLPLGESNYKEYSEEKKILIGQKNKKTKEEKIHELLTIEPYVDILEGNNLNKKISAIEKLSNIVTKESVEILKRALGDELYEVRYFSQYALEKIEKNLMDKIDIFSDEIERHPGDYVLFNQRGAIYLDCFQICLFDEVLGRDFLQKSLYDFLFSLQINPEQSYLYVKIVQIHLQLEDYDEVVSIVNSALRSDLSKDDRLKVIFFRAEANFHLRKFKQVQNDCKLMENNFDYQKIKESSDYWSRMG